MVEKNQDQSPRRTTRQWNRSPGQMGGARPGAGRKEGSKNKITSELKDKLEPLENLGLKRLEEILRNKGTDQKILMAAIELVLAYRHGKPKHTSVISDPDGGSTQVDWLSFLARAHEYSKASLQQSAGHVGKEPRAHKGRLPAGRAS